jgi:hypothetical protein
VGQKRREEEMGQLQGDMERHLAEGWMEEGEEEGQRKEKQLDGMMQVHKRLVGRKGRAEKEEVVETQVEEEKQGGQEQRVERI